MHRFPALPHILFRGFQHLRHTTLAAGTAVKNQCLHIPNFSAKVGRKYDFGIKQVLFAGIFSEISPDSAQINRRNKQIRGKIL